MLNDLERDVDETNERMNFVMGKLSQLLKTKGEEEDRGALSGLEAH